MWIVYDKGAPEDDGRTEKKEGKGQANCY